jgi:hypothetical protein
MPLASFKFKAGINKENTDYSEEGGWVNANFIRFRKGVAEKIGGWVKYVESAFLGIGRAIHSWIALDGTKYAGLGTTLKYYIEAGAVLNDVTPIRSTTAAGDVTFSATDGSSTITVSDTANGSLLNDFVTFSGAVSLGGLITADVLNQEYQIQSIVDADSYTITAKDTSGVTVTANASDTGNGGASVVGEYQINVGLDDYVQSTGWGVNAFGAGAWGSSSALSANNQLRLWTHDNFGEDLVINPRGGGIYYWDESNGLATRAEELQGLSGASFVPTLGLQVITSETDRHLIVLGADPINDAGTARTGVIDPMLVAFSDQENALDFEPLTTNTAGSVQLSSGSFIIGGLKSRQEILIWTDTSLYSMQFIGPPLTFAVNLINEGVGLLAPKAAGNTPAGVIFMSKQGFHIYNGAVQKLPCSVKDYVYSDLDMSQSFKCFAAVNQEFGEIWFFYPSLEDGTEEISRYVLYNYEENVWSIGSLVRHAWKESGVENKPLATGGSDSSYYLYSHEEGSNDDTNPMTNVFIESADLDIGDGENFAFVKKVLPDVKFLTETDTNTPAINFVLKRRDFSNQSLTTDSTTQITAASTEGFLRSRGRQFVLRFESDDDNVSPANNKDFKWRLGSTRLDVQASGRR